MPNISAAHSRRTSQRGESERSKEMDRTLSAEKKIGFNVPDNQTSKKEPTADLPLKKTAPGRRMSTISSGPQVRIMSKRERASMEIARRERRTGFIPKKKSKKRSTSVPHDADKNDMSAMFIQDDFPSNIWWESAVKNSEKIFRNSTELTHEIQKKYGKV